MEFSRVHIIKLVILSLAMVGTMTTWFSMTAVLPELIELWELTSTEASLITIMVQLGFVIGSLILAFLNLPDRIKPPMLFFVSASLAGLLTIFTVWFADDLTSALMMRFLTGVALSGVYGPGLKLITTWFRIRRGMALGFVVGALTLGSATPHLVTGLGAPSWEVVLISTGLCSVLAGILVIVAVDVGPYLLPSSSKFNPRAIPRILSHKPVRLANYGYFGHMWELYAMWAWFGLFLAHSLESRGMDSSGTASILTFIIIASGFFGAWFGGIYADRIGRERLTLWSLAVSGSISLVIGFFFGSPVWLIVSLGVIWGISIIADSAQFSALITEHTHPRYVGTALTLQLAIGFLLTVIVILLVPMIEAIVGWQYAFLILVPGPVLGFIAMFRLLLLQSKSNQ
ncbi:MFS transporter [Salipaludibacillus sp. HK11]|uniref:MFS transporter n=1 Tax=Salipaludibacillus sp. HK11 TaxID=3394320 RepID=UPI0039FBF091